MPSAALLRLDDEGAALQVALAQRAAYLQFLADDALPFRAHDLQAHDASALAALQGTRSRILPKRSPVLRAMRLASSSCV